MQAAVSMHNNMRKLKILVMYRRVMAAEAMGVRGMSLPPPVEPLLVSRRAPLGQVKKAAQQHMADMYTMLEHWQVQLLFNTSLYCIMSCHVMSCHVMSCHVMSCHVMSCHVVSCHVMSCRVMSCHVMSCHVMSCHVMSCHVMYCKIQCKRHVMSCNAMSCHVL